MKGSYDFFIYKEKRYGFIDLLIYNINIVISGIRVFSYQVSVIADKVIDLSVMVIASSYDLT